MTLDEVFSGMGDGARDVAGAGLADVQNHYQQFLTGRPAPLTAPIGEMETTTEPQIAAPESYTTALLKHGVSVGLETEADHWREVAGRTDADMSDIAPGATGWERYAASLDMPATSAAPAAEPDVSAYEPEL